MKRIFIAISTLLVLQFTAQAQIKNKSSNTNEKVSETPIGYQEHDGFYLSLGLGAIGGTIDNTYQSQTMTFGGIGADLDVKIGFAIAPNTIFFGTLTSKAVSGPTLTMGSQTITASNEYAIGERLIGVGLMKYTESNVFFSGAVGSGNFSTLHNNNITASSSKGLSFQLKVGKEWWISDNWAIGFNVNYAKTMVTETNTETLNSNRFGVQLCATFN
jgi:hypothetical protein